ncbi:MAG TPA: ABC transporter ATP-binding protein [Pirellulales bacterium]|jgi:putative ABC transport system ATP-binding protein|nr:ABC transporter ATP-binding protein [Pirellulales bacterium]
MSAIVCRNVTKDFGSGSAKVQALRGVDLDVPLGEMTLLVGPSGCGKTTLLSVIAGIMHPTEGKVSVLGADIDAMSGAQVVRFRGKNIGFVFQQFNLLPALSAAENVAVPLIIGGMRRRPAVARAKELLALVGLKDRMNALPLKLSGGQQQRVAIARALSHEPRLMVCDEPTSALDAHTGHIIMELLHEVAVTPDRSVIVVTHDNRVFEFGDRIAYMDDGRVIRVEQKTSRRDAALAALHVNEATWPAHLAGADSRSISNSSAARQGQELPGALADEMDDEIADNRTGTNS